MTDKDAATGRGATLIEAEAASEKLRFTGLPRIIIVAFTLFAIALTVNQLFNLKLTGSAILDGVYLNLLAGIFLCLAFLTFRARAPHTATVPWYDWILFAAAVATGGYMAFNAETAATYGWEYAAPDHGVWAAIVFYLLILEGTRRTGGNVLFGVVLLFSLYPTFADRVPDPLSGFTQPFRDVVPFFMYSAEGSFGIPMQAFGTLVIGFILFGAVLQYTGGGRFFNDLALALVGRYRGGSAKVAIFASGFMGSMSGSVISNVLTTGAVSIPAMRQAGFSARYAAATEACASTGGVLMPPIMGATAFVMASWLGLPYTEIMLAAAIPSLLYYFGLFAQIDAYSARRGLRGMAKEILPRLGATFRSGWIYIFVFALLIYLMVAYRWERTAPFYAILLLLVINQVKGPDRFSVRGFFDMIASVGRILAELVAVLLGIGMIVGAFQATGLTGPLAGELVALAGNSVALLLIMGAVTAFIFGMGMTVTACYIFLAVILAPALVQAGLNELAVHLFILYWGMVSYITPPVALGAFAAASMAGADPMKTGLEAMRLGGVIYITPFFFVLNPALIGQAGTGEVLFVLACAIAGIWFISAALQGHVSLVGSLGSGAAGAALRVLLFFAGLLIAAPMGGLGGLSHTMTTLLGFALAAAPLALAWRAGEAPVSRAA
jgi:TRAP transporter 4TM/12TM fusion protein